MGFDIFKAGGFETFEEENKKQGGLASGMAGTSRNITDLTSVLNMDRQAAASAPVSSPVSTSRKENIRRLESELYGDTPSEESASTPFVNPRMEIVNANLDDYQKSMGDSERQYMEQLISQIKAPTVPQNVINQGQYAPVASPADFRRVDELSSVADPYRNAEGLLGTTAQSIALGKVMKDINAINIERVKRNDPYYGMDELNRLNREAARYSEAFHPVDVENMTWRDMPEFAASNVAVSLPMTGELMAKGLLGGLAGKAMIGAGLAGSATGIGAPVGAPLAAAGVGVQAGTIGYTAMKEAEMEGASVYEAARAEGKDHDTAVQMANDAYMKNLHLLMGTNAAEQLLAFGLPFSEGGTIAKTVAKTQSKVGKLKEAMDATRGTRLLKGAAEGAGKAAGVTGRVAAGAGVEGGQELAQYGIQESALGHDIDWSSPEAKESALAGATMGGVFTGGGMALSGLLNRLNRAPKGKGDDIDAGAKPYLESARQRVDTLVDAGMPRGQALDQVANELSKGLIQPTRKDAEGGGPAPAPPMPDAPQLPPGPTQPQVPPGTVADTSGPGTVPPVTPPAAPTVAPDTTPVTPPVAPLPTNISTEEVAPGATVYHKGNPVQVVSIPNNEFYIVQDAAGKKMAVAQDEVEVRDAATEPVQDTVTPTAPQEPVTPTTTESPVADKTTDLTDDTAKTDAIPAGETGVSQAGDRVVEGQKEPWQMTREEFVKFQAPIKDFMSPDIDQTRQQFLKENQWAGRFEELTKKLNGLKGDKAEYLQKHAGSTGDYWGRKAKELDVSIKQAEQEIQKYHKEIIQQAVSDGKPVPTEVLADYPELAQTPEQKPPAQPEPSQATADSIREVYNSITQARMKERGLTESPDQPLLAKEVADEWGKTHGMKPTQARKAFREAVTKMMEEGTAGDIVIGSVRDVSNSLGRITVGGGDIQLGTVYVRPEKQAKQKTKQTDNIAEMTREDVKQILASQPANKGKDAERLAGRWIASDRFVKMTIPVNSVGIAAPAEGKSVTKGPIIVDLNINDVGRYKGMYGAAPVALVIDGKHRLSEAIAKGEETIEAMVGEKAVSFIEREAESWRAKRDEISKVVSEYASTPNGTTLSHLSAKLDDAEVQKIRQAVKAIHEGNNPDEALVEKYPEILQAETPSAKMAEGAANEQQEKPPESGVSDVTGETVTIKAPWQMTRAEFLQERPAVEGYRYHGSPDGDLKTIDPYAHTQTWQEGIGFYTTNSRDAAKTYAEGRTAAGDRKGKRGTVNYIDGRPKAVLDMDAPIDKAFWKSVVEARTDDYAEFANELVDTKTNAEGYKEAVHYLRDEHGTEAQYSVEETMVDKGITATAHIEGKKSGKPHQVLIHKTAEGLRIVPPEEVHRKAIEKAIKGGKNVPPEVLRYYSDLGQQKKEASAKAIPAPTLTGKNTTAKTERGTAVEVQYTVVSANDLIASHNVDLSKNEAYPEEIQPRQRERAASEDQINRIAANLEPEFLGESPKASEGAPIVGPDLVVESGNGRVIALQRVFRSKKESASRYKEWLVDNAEKFGIDKEALNKVEKPVLVRIRKTEVDRVKFAQEANEQSVASMSATEQAKVDAEKLDSGILKLFVPSETGEIRLMANADFIKAFMGMVVGPAERGRYVTADGALSQEGITRIKYAIFAKAYGDVTAIATLAESTDNNVKNITNAMLIAAPKLAKVKEGIESGTLHNLDISGDIAAAMKKLSHLRDVRDTVEGYLAQVAMFEQELSDIARSLLKLFNDNKRYTKRMAAVLNNYADSVQAFGDPRQVTMFSPAKPTKEETLIAAIRKVEKESGKTNNQTSLFQDETPAVRGVHDREGARGVSEEGRKPEESDEEVVKAKAEKPKSATAKEKALASQLRKQAATMQKTIDAKRNPGVANQNPTARRARIAAGMAADADRLENIQSKLVGLADAIENGTLPETLAGIRTRAHVEVLMSREFPKARILDTYLKDILKYTEGMKGSAEPRRIVSQGRMVSDWGRELNDRQLAAMDALLKLAENKAESPSLSSTDKRSIKGIVKTIKDQTHGYKTLKVAGINADNFAQARRDLMSLGEQKPAVPAKEQTIKTLERGLIGAKIPGYFPTPKTVVTEMLDRAEIEAGMKVLEPSAGKGNIADLIREKEPESDLSVIEVNSTLRDILEAKEYDIVGSDFLEHEGEYDRIIMNPPFEKGQDVDHVKHAYELLKPGGRLVSIMSESPFFRGDKKYVAFREWLEEVGGTSEKLPDKSFTGKEADRQTGAATRIVVIDKAEAVETAKAVRYKRTVSLKEISNILDISLSPANQAISRPEIKAANTLTKLMTGNDLVLYKGTAAIQGMSIGDTIYLNVHARQPLLYVVKHEIVHTLRNTDPEAYAKLMDLVQEYFDGNQEMFKHYKKQGYEANEVWDEFVADTVSEVMETDGFWAKVREKVPALIRKIVGILDGIISRYRQSVSKELSALRYIKNVEAFRDKVAGVTAEALARSRRQNVIDIRNTDAIVARLKKEIARAEAQFAVRQGKPPQKTIKAYKLMRIDKQGRLFPLFVERRMETPKGVWMDAKAGEMITTKTGGQKVKSSLGGLAFRPGWHLGDIPLATHIGIKGPSGKIEYMNPNHVWVECEVAADNNYQDQADANGINPKTGRLNKARADLKEIPVDGFYRFKTNSNMTGEWIITGSMKIKRVLSDEETAGIVRKAGYEPLPRKAQETSKAPTKGASLLADKGARFKLTLPDTEVQERMEKARGVPKDSMREKIKELLTEVYNKGHREYQHLPRTGEFAELRNSLLNLRKQKGISADKTLRLLDDITKPLDEFEYDVFSHKVIFDDLAHEHAEDRALPFGLTEDNFQDIKDYIDGEAANLPKVQAAINKRKKAWANLKKAYTKAQKDVGFKVEDRLTKEDYYHHQVLEYANKKGLMRGSRRLRVQTGRGFLRKRGGSDLDINTDYLQAEFEVMAQMLLDTAEAKTVKIVKDNHDIMQELKHEAVSMNDAAMLEEFQKMLDQMGDTETTPEQMYSSLLNKKQAIAFSQLYAMAGRGELPIDPAGRYGDLVDALTEAYHEWQEAKINAADMGEPAPKGASVGDEWQAELWKYLNWLADRENTDEQSQIVARSVFKGIAQKKKAIINALGDKYVTWEDLIPEGYTKWQPREGHIFYMVTSIPEAMSEQLFYGIVDSMKVDVDMLKRVMAVGQKYPELVIKKEVAQTLEDMYVGSKGDSPVAKILYFTPYRAWKQWQLISPRRYFRYNTRNMTGDLDAVLAGNPGALKPDNLKKAWSDLWQAFFTKDKVMSPELKAWFERGGFETLMQAQEINEINRNRQFRHLMESRMKTPAWEKMLKSPATAWNTYWDFARTSTDFREAFLRYACFLDYAKQMQGNRQGKPNNFGASNKDEIMAIQDPKDRAAKLANELLGAYDEVSVIGVWLADHAFPFWRWNEVNFVRYSKLFRNAYRDGKLMAAVAGKTTGLAVRSPYIAWQVGKFVVKAAALTAMITAWNLLFFDDEEKELPEDVGNRLHIIFGRDRDGKVLYFSRLGALQDFVDWFGLDTPIKHVQDYLSGRRSIKEIATDLMKADANKIINALTPVVKTPFELLFDRKLFPDAFSAMPIRDKWQYLFDSIGLGNEYKALAGKPSRGYASSLPDFFLYRSDPYETAYFASKENVRRYQKKIGKYNEGYSESIRSDALYNIKLAMRYGDKEAARKYLIEYIKLGGTEKGLKQSMRSLDPLSGLSKDDRQPYYDQLDAIEKENLAKAYQYYLKVIGGEMFLKD